MVRIQPIPSSRGLSWLNAREEHCRLVVFGPFGQSVHFRRRHSSSCSPSFFWWTVIIASTWQNVSRMDAPEPRRPGNGQVIEPICPYFQTIVWLFRMLFRTKKANTLKPLSKDERYFPSTIDYMLPHYSFVSIWFFLSSCGLLLIIL